MKKYTECEALLKDIEEMLDTAQQHINITGRGIGKTLWAGIYKGINFCKTKLLAAPAADVVEVTRLGKVGQLMLHYDGCPRGRVGRMGSSGGEEDKTELLIRELCYMDTFEDADGNVWRPVSEEVLQEAMEILRNKEE